MAERERRRLSQWRCLLHTNLYDELAALVLRPGWEEVGVTCSVCDAGTMLLLLLTF